MKSEWNDYAVKPWCGKLSGKGVLAQLVRERSSTGVSARWATVDCFWPKQWHWCVLADLHFIKKKASGDFSRTFQTKHKESILYQVRGSRRFRYLLLCPLLDVWRQRPLLLPLCPRSSNKLRDVSKLCHRPLCPDPYKQTAVWPKFTSPVAGHGVDEVPVVERVDDSLHNQFWESVYSLDVGMAFSAKSEFVQVRIAITRASVIATIIVIVTVISTAIVISTTYLSSSAKSFLAYASTIHLSTNK